MTITTLPDATAADQHEVVLGVDTHRDEHVTAVLSILGGLLATSAFPTCRRSRYPAGLRSGNPAVGSVMF